MPNYYTAVDRPPKVKLTCTVAEGKTRQSEKDECDVNKIVDRFYKTGLIPLDKRQAMFMDISEMPDYRTACDNVLVAEELFMSLPSKVRKEFNNSPAEFLDFVADEANKDALVELGLMPGDGEPDLEPEPVPEPPPAPEVPA